MWVSFEIYTPNNKNELNKGNNTKNHDININPRLQNQFSIFVQININTSEKSKYIILKLLNKETIIPVMAKIK